MKMTELRSNKNSDYFGAAKRASEVRQQKGFSKVTVQASNTDRQFERQTNTASIRRKASKSSDRKLLMVPHMDHWVIFITVTIVAHASFVISTFGFMVEKDETYMDILHYSFEGLFLTDMVLTMLHRSCSSHKTDLCTRKRPFLLLFIGWASLMPYHEAYVYFLDGLRSARLKNAFRYKVVLRLFQVMHYFSSRRHEAGNNQFLTIVTNYLFLDITYVMFGSVLWQYLGCYKCGTPNWMNNLGDVDYDEGRILDKFLYPYTFIGSLMTANYGGVIKPDTFWEYFVVAATMLVAELLKTTMLKARLIEQYINKHQKQWEFNSRLENTFQYIEKQGIDRQLLNDIKEFYNTLWHKKKAIATIPTCFELLPLSLQKDVMVDIFWDALIHTHLFRHVNMTFKRELSLIMESEFLLAGDFIYNTGQLKMKMIYVVTGIVQVLSNEDDQSPVMSFSSGTVIGELSCLMLTQSNCKLRCATFCEFQTLPLTHLCRKLVLHRNQTSQFRNVLDKRIHDSKVLHAKKGEGLEQKGEGLEQKALSRPIARMKTQWRAMQKERHPKSISPCHTSQYLDLLVLSDEMELKVQVVSLTATFPFILDPTSSFRHACDMLCIGAVVLQSIIVPYCAAFNRGMNPRVNTVCLLLDFIYVFDFALQVTTAIKEKDKMVVTFAGIVMSRIKNLSFQVDVFATIPYDYIYAVGNSDPQVYVLCKLPRLCKIYKLIALIQSHEKKLGRNTILTKFVKYGVILTISVFFSTCLAYMISCYNEECYPHSWFQRNRELAGEIQGNDHIWDSLRTMYRMLAVINGSGCSDRYSYDVVDTWVTYMASLFGSMLLVFAISEITSAEYWEMHERRGHNILVMSMLKFARIHRVSSKLTFRVGNMLRFRWEYSGDLIKCDAMQVFKDCPANLRERICYSLVTKYLENSDLFRGVDEVLVKRIAMRSSVIAYPPNSYVTFADRIISHIYIIKRGYCLGQSLVPGDMEKNTTMQILSAGHAFPLVEVLHEVNSFVTVKALTTVEIIAIPYKVMMRYFKMAPGEYRTLKQALQSHMQDNFSVLMRAQHRLDITAKNPTTKFGDMFVYNKPTDITADTGPKVGETINSVFGFCTETIHPYSKFFICCEVLRCFFAVVQFLLVIFYINVLFSHRDTVNAVNYMLDLTVGVDMLIKSRVYYYDSDGKYETRGREVLRHYCRTSLSLDIFTVLPVNLISFNEIISSRQPLAVSGAVMLMTRPLQLYRVFYGLSLLFDKYKIVSPVNAVRIIYFLFMLVVISICANFFILAGCDISETEVHCPMNQWRGTSIKLYASIDIVVYLYVAIEYLVGSSSLLYISISNMIYLVTLLICTGCVITMWFINSRLISNALHDEYMTSQLQNDRRNFRMFARTNTLDEELTVNMLKTNEYLTRDVVSYAMEQAEMRFTPQLLDDFAYSINRRAIETTVLMMHAPEELIRFISSKVSRRFYKKDGYIIRNNDVQDQIFIVKQGKVEISVASSHITTLACGSMFGCFAKYGFVRQTVTAKASLHTEILAIKSQYLYSYIAKYPSICHKMERFAAACQEYLESLAVPPEEVSIGVSTEDHTSIVLEPVTRYTRVVNKIFNQSSSVFIFFNYILNVHMASISAIFVLQYQLTAMYGSPLGGRTTMLYMIDALYLIKVFFGLSLTYIDQNSGVVITHQRKIIMRYLKKDFALDIVTMLPVELVVYFAFESVFYQSLFAANRVLRILFLVKYYNYYKRNNKLTHSLRLIYHIYLLLVSVQFFTNAWNYAGCFKDKACYQRTEISHGPIAYQKAESVYLSHVIAYTHVLNCLTTSSMRAIAPMSIEQIWTTAVILISTPLLFTMLCSGFASIEVIDNYSLGKYDYVLREMKTYLQYQRLSPSIFKQVCRYYVMLWKVQNGEQIPALITDSTNYIKQDIMFDLFSHHLCSHRLFRNTHRDFLRQLTAYFKRCTYPNNYVIVESGDIDKTIYFIHSGKVMVIEKTTFQQQVLYELGKNQSFGEEQGLLGSPHKHTFMANTFVEIVTLNKNDWGFLLEFFPASHEEILQRARSEGLFDVSKISI